MAKDIAAIIDGEIVFVYKDKSAVGLLLDEPPWCGSCNDVISLNGHKGEVCLSLALYGRQGDC